MSWMRTQEWTCRRRGGARRHLCESAWLQSSDTLTAQSPVRPQCAGPAPNPNDSALLQFCPFCAVLFAFSRWLLTLGTLAHARWLSGTFFRKCLLESFLAHVFPGVCLTDPSVGPARNVRVANTCVSGCRTLAAPTACGPCCAEGACLSPLLWQAA